MESGSLAQARAVLFARLQERRTEIELAVLTRVYAVSDLGDADPEYAEGLRAAISAAVAYGLAAVELGEQRSPPPPPILRAQARMAARNRVSLDTVLRRYFAGHALLGDYLIEEAEQVRGLRGSGLQCLLRTQGTLFDRLLAVVSEEYAREERERLNSSGRRLAERIERLLAGELLDTSDLAYDFHAHHLGAVAYCPGAVEALAELASRLDRRLLTIERDDGVLWAWLGGSRATDADELQQLLSVTWPAHASVALGEPAEGLAGWRFTHRQAKAAFPVLQRKTECHVRYAEVALVASILQDDLLATSLHELYLAPLERARDGGKVAQETLRAYFTADRNVSSAAAALGVNRNTVTSRLQAVEASIGASLNSCAAELEAALRLAALAKLPNAPISSAVR